MYIVYGVYVALLPGHESTYHVGDIKVYLDSQRGEGLFLYTTSDQILDGGNEFSVCGHPLTRNSISLFPTSNLLSFFRAPILLQRAANGTKVNYARQSNNAHISHA